MAKNLNQKQGVRSCQNTLEKSFLQFVDKKTSKVEKSIIIQ